MGLKSKVIGLSAIALVSTGIILTAGGGTVHAERNAILRIGNQSSFLADKEPLLLNTLSEQEINKMQNLLTAGDEFGLSKFLAETIYSIGFSNIINDTKGTMSGGAYEKEFNENIQWFKDSPKDEWSHNGMKAFYLENPKPTDKTVVLVHGFSSMPENMGGWAKLYYDLGYNILTPELRAHGSSSEKNRSLGWKDKDDIVEWTHFLNKKKCRTRFRNNFIRSINGSFSGYDE